jgi:cell division protein FtsQ
MKKQLVIALLLLILLSTFIPQKLSFINKFNIKKIEVENNSILKDQEIKNELAFLYNTNLIFLNTLNIQTSLKKKTFLKGFEIKKVYPSTLKIKIFEKKPIFILQQEDEKFFLNKNIELINYLDLEKYKKLPVIFGDKKNFEILYKNLQKIDFPLKLIKNFYLFELNRWDLETYEEKIIKLPPENYNESLKNFMILREKNNFDKYNLFDYRIVNQLILK